MSPIFAARNVTLVGTQTVVADIWKVPGVRVRVEVGVGAAVGFGVDVGVYRDPRSSLGDAVGVWRIQA